MAVMAMALAKRRWLMVVVDVGGCGCGGDDAVNVGGVSEAVTYLWIAHQMSLLMVLAISVSEGGCGSCRIAAY